MAGCQCEATEIYFVTHGHCSGMIAGDLCSFEGDVPTEFVLQQASALGQHLRHVSFTRAYCSSYPPAVKTACRILREQNKRINLCHLNNDARLREREIGALIGVRWDACEWQHIFQQYSGGRHIYEIEFPGKCESASQFLVRQESFLKELLCNLLDDATSCGKPSNILVVTHMVTLKSLMDALIDGQFSKFVILSDTQMVSFPWPQHHTSHCKISVRCMTTSNREETKFILTFKEINL